MGWLEKQHDYSVFVETVRRRLDAGHREYGDASFARDPDELLAEIQEEIEDIAGWSFVLWCRLRDLREKVTTKR